MMKFFSKYLLLGVILFTTFEPVNAFSFSLLAGLKSRLNALGNFFWRTPEPIPTTEIGIIKIFDAINTSTVESYIKKIYTFSKDPRIQGILLVINSGGGSAGASDLLFREIKVLSEIKPVVALVVSYCASGAYLAALGAHWIITSAISEIGSIGVRQDIEKYKNLKLHNKDYSADIDRTIIYAGKYKIVDDPNSAPLTEEQTAYLQKGIDNAYAVFLETVAQQRKLSLDDYEKWADGRVFTGKEALTLGLTDQIGGFSDALAKLQELIEKSGAQLGELFFVE